MSIEMLTSCKQLLYSYDIAINLANACDMISERPTDASISVHVVWLL